MAGGEKLTKAWLPGFDTRAKAIRRGRKTYERANGDPGREDRHFHIFEGVDGRWHIADGPSRLLAETEARE